MKLLIALTRDLPVGTNLALLQFFWMLVSGALLPQRGALFPALQATGLSAEATRRAWAAFRKGVWQTVVLLRLWQAQIEGLPGAGASTCRLSRHYGRCDRILAASAAKLSEQTLSSGSPAGTSGGDFRRDRSCRTNRRSTFGLPTRVRARPS